MLHSNAAHHETVVRRDHAVNMNCHCLPSLIIAIIYLCHICILTSSITSACHHCLSSLFTHVHHHLHLSMSSNAVNRHQLPPLSFVIVSCHLRSSSKFVISVCCIYSWLLLEIRAKTGISFYGEVGKWRANSLFCLRKIFWERLVFSYFWSTFRALFWLEIGIVLHKF